jgi:cell division protein FtsL
MNTLLFIVLRYVGRALLLLAVILLVILCGIWVRTQWVQSVLDRATVEDCRSLVSRAVVEKGTLDQQVATLSCKDRELALMAGAHPLALQ